MTSRLPADDPLGAQRPVGHAAAQLPVDLQRHPDGRGGLGQAQRRVPLTVGGVDVGPPGQKQPDLPRNTYAHTL